MATAAACRFPYLPEWRVVVCEECGYCLRPGEGSTTRHLRREPHRLRGAELRALVELLGSYDVGHLSNGHGQRGILPKRCRGCGSTTDSDASVVAAAARAVGF
jgi:hypothetical protein